MTADPRGALDKAPSTSSSSSTSRRDRRPAVDVCSEFRATPAMAGVPVMCVSDDRRRRGADPRSSKPVRTTSWPGRSTPASSRRESRRCFCGSSARRDLSPVISSDGVTLAKAEADGRGLQPEGRRRNHDHRDEHRGRGGARDGPTGSSSWTSPSSSGTSPRTSTSTRSRPSPTSFATTPRCASRSCCGRMRRGTTAGSMSSPHRPRPRRRSRSRPSTSRSILRTLLEAYDFVVVDAGSTLDERTQAVFEAAETDHPVGRPRDRRPQRDARDARIPRRDRSRSRDKSIFVVNELFAREILKTRTSRECSVRRSRCELPYDPFLYLKAVNEGIPIVVDAPRSAPGERLVKLSQMAFGADSTAAPAITDSKRTGGMFRRRR